MASRPLLEQRRMKQVPAPSKTQFLTMYSGICWRPSRIRVEPDRFQCPTLRSASLSIRPIVLHCVAARGYSSKRKHQTPALHQTRGRKPSEVTTDRSLEWFEKGFKQVTRNAEKFGNLQSVAKGAVSTLEMRRQYHCLEHEAHKYPSNRSKRHGLAHHTEKPSSKSLEVIESGLLSREMTRNALIWLAIAALLVYAVYEVCDLSFLGLHQTNTRFREYQIYDVIDISSDLKLFQLHSKRELGPDPRRPDAQGTWSIDVVQPDLQITRAYSPIPVLDGSASKPSNKSRIDLLVRKAYEGEVSSYLHRISPGRSLTLKSNKTVEFELLPDTTEIVFIAGGTGIAPALQLAQQIREKQITGSRDPHEELSQCRMTILWAARSPEECLGVTRAIYGQPSMRISDVDAAQKKYFATDEHGNSTRLQVASRLFFDDQKTFIRGPDVAKACDEMAATQEGSSHKKLILVSGPDGFVNHVAGPKGMSAGIETQGPIGGLLAGVSLKDWAVWKL